MWQTKLTANHTLEGTLKHTNSMFDFVCSENKSLVYGDAQILGFDKNTYGNGKRLRC